MLNAYAKVTSNAWIETRSCGEFTVTWIFFKAGEQAVLRATQNISAQVMEEQSNLFLAVAVWTCLETEIQIANSFRLFMSSVSQNGKNP